MASFSGGGSDFPPLLGINSPVEEGYWVSLETIDNEKPATQLQLFTVKKFLEQNFPETLTTWEGKLMIQTKTKKLPCKQQK
jgi:hypothetical protein